MNKKQEKAEMIKLIGNVKPFYVETIAKALYDAGYRKVDDVRKETAREILDMLYDMGIDKETLECCRIFDVNGVSFTKQICEKYDVEVENDRIR